MAIGQIHRVQSIVTVNETHAEQKHEKKPFLFPKCSERENNKKKEASSTIGLIVSRKILEKK